MSDNNGSELTPIGGPLTGPQQRELVRLLDQGRHLLRDAERMIGEIERQRDECSEQLDHAVTWIGVVLAELVESGGARGDRDVALANLRALIKERNELRDEVTDWALVADGVKHDWRCSPPDLPCMRCRLELVERQRSALRDELDHLRALTVAMVAIDDEPEPEV